MKRILFVVHRYFPLPGGSEYNVQNMAEECVKRGIETWVLSDRHQGDRNGVKVTNDRSIAFQSWNMIVVHGSCPTQDFIHTNSAGIGSKIYYLLVQPSDHPLAVYGMQHAEWIGCGTSFDWAHVRKYGLEKKAVQHIYGIPDDSLGKAGFRAALHIMSSKLYISAGGFWPHKRMTQLRDAFIKAQVPDTTLVLFGYDSSHGNIPEAASNVIVLNGFEKEVVLAAMAEGNLYISNSEAEGYGVVLLEAMYNQCPWLSTNVAAAHDLAQYGTIFEKEEELIHHLQHWAFDPIKTDYAYKYVTQNQMAKHCIDNLEKLL